VKKFRSGRGPTPANDLRQGIFRQHRPVADLVVDLTPRRSVAAEDIRDFQSGTEHGLRALRHWLGPLGCQRRETIERAHDRADHVGGHLRVERCGIELGVPEQNLDQADIDILFEQVRGKAVALMPSSALTALCRVPDYAE